jgi:hypothetical protein
VVRNEAAVRSVRMGIPPKDTEVLPHDTHMEKLFGHNMCIIPPDPSNALVHTAIIWLEHTDYANTSSNQAS